MARLNALGSPGVYAISFKDTEYNPQTKIVEGTTGQRYASNYMGARSRWWDLSMKQAVYETGQIDAYNKAIDAEIAEIQKSIADIQRDYVKRYDTMQRHNDTIQNQRDKFTAEVGPTITRVDGTRAPRGGRGTSGLSPAEGKARNTAIIARVRTVVEQSDKQGGLANDATNLEVLRQDGALFGDEYSQDMTAYYIVQDRAVELADRLMANGMPKDKATEPVSYTHSPSPRDRQKSRMPSSA